MEKEIEFVINELGATAIAVIKDDQLQRIKFPVKIPKRFYSSFLNDAEQCFYEKYPQY